MSWAETNAFERLDRQDHRNDPTLAVDGLSDLFPSQTMLDPESALAVGAFGDLFPGREADAVDYFSIANDAPTVASEVQTETPVDDELFEVEPVFESGHIVQTDSQRAAMEFQRFAEKFHAFAAECQERVTV
jgi:hypothetical protein